MEEHVFIRSQVARQDLDANRLATIQVNADAGDRALIDTLIDNLSVAIRRDTIGYEVPDIFPLPANCMLWQWLDVYLKAIQHSEFVAWAVRQSLDLKSLRVHGGTLYANAVIGNVTTPRVMALHDDSGWWRVAGPIRAIVQIIDPAGIDKFGLGDPSIESSQAFSLRATLAFHGYPLPANRPQAHVMVDELRRLSGFPVIDNSGHIATSVSVEQAEQVKDCAKLASELQRVLQDRLADGEEYDFLETYRRRIKLDSGSMLAQTMISALRLLQGLSIKLNVGRVSAPTGYYFSRIEGALMEIDRFSVPQAVAADRLSAPEVLADLRELVAQAQRLGSDVHPDGCFSLASVLRSYGRETPADAVQVRELITALGQSPESSTPYVHASAHSAAALLRHRRYLGLLNNRFLMGLELEILSRAPAATDPVTTSDMNVYVDRDSPLSELTEVGRKELLAVMELEEFKSIQTARQLDPARHVLVTGSGYVGARALDGTWIDLGSAVQAVTVLAGRFQSLAAIAGRLGGALRSSGEVTLEQMLKFYSFAPPVTAGEARALAQRLRAVPLRPRPAVEYWNALGGTFASVSSPLLSRRSQIIEEPEHFMPRIGTSLYYWSALKRADVIVVLSASQREQVRNAAVQFTAATNEVLFNYLAQPVVTGKSRESLRAEADLLVSQMLAGPRARKLADKLSLAVTWQGEQARHAMTRAGRRSLVLAALILSLDPQAGQNRNRIAGIDLANEQYWGDNYDRLLANIEARLGSDHRLGATTAPLAAHVLLSGVAPEFLVRDIPEQMAYMSGLSWVYFKQCVTLLEGSYPGSTRRLAFDNIMSGERLGAIKPEYLKLNEFSGPVVDWAKTNGVLPKNAGEFTPADLSTAKAALLAQFHELGKAIASLRLVTTTRRKLALADLRRVFPGNEMLEAKVLVQQQDLQNLQKASCVDLHLAGQLATGSNHWHSTLETFDYAVMAERLPLLHDVNRSYGNWFMARESELWTAYVQAIQFSLSLMMLSHRKRLEYGALTLFSVSQSAAGVVTKGRFGVLVLSQHPAFADCAYEFFPLQLLFVERTDLNVAQLLADAGAVFADATAQHAPTASTLPVLLPLDGAAYEKGRIPTHGATAKVILEKVGHMAPVANEASPYSSLLSVPRTFSSLRIRSLASDVLSNSLFAPSLGLRLTAAGAISLDDAISGRDPWSDYLDSMTGHEALQV